MLEVTTIEPFFDELYISDSGTCHLSLIMDRRVFRFRLREKLCKLLPGLVCLLDLKRGMALNPVHISSCIGFLVGFRGASIALIGNVRYLAFQIQGSRGAANLKLIRRQCLNRRGRFLK